MFHIRNLAIVWVAVFAGLVLASVTHGMAWAKVFGIDYLFHVGIYTLLAFLSVLLFRRFRTVIVPVSFMMAAALCFEILHSTVNGSTFEDVDYLLNNFGVFIGAVAASIMLRLHGDGLIKGEHIRKRAPDGHPYPWRKL